MNTLEKVMSIIGGITFLGLGLWFESAYSAGSTALLIFVLVFIVAVVATILSYAWKPYKRKVEKCD